MAKNDGGPAFPSPGTKLEGMSLRDSFAGLALSGLIARGSGHGPPHTPQDVARVAYEYADEMIARRDGS